MDLKNFDKKIENFQAIKPYLRLITSTIQYLNRLPSNILPLSQLINFNIKNNIEFLNKHGCKKIKILSHEGHFNSSFVSLCLLNTSQHVIYDRRRAFPVIFKDALDLYCNETGSLLNKTIDSPRDIKEYNNFRVRPYIKSKKIKNPLASSYLCGELLALTQFLSITDLHYGNVVFNSEGIPVVLDDECCCLPVRNSQIINLSKNRKFFPHSPFRSHLIRDNSHDFLTSGFKQILSEENIKNAIVSGYLFGFNNLKKNRQKILDMIISSSYKHPYSRYLIRRTEFYDICKAFYGKILSDTGETDTSTVYLQKCFEIEKSLYQDLIPAIPFEIKSIANGDTPYFVINHNSGIISEGVGGKEIFCIDKSPLEWMEEHINFLCREKECIDNFISIFKKLNIFV